MKHEARPKQTIQPETAPKPKAGLPPEIHNDLNRPALIYPGGEEARNAKIEQLRTQYANDPVALQHLDVYDTRTEYHLHLREFVDALKSGDVETQTRIQRWMEERYPDVSNIHNP